MTTTRRLSRRVIISLVALSLLVWLCGRVLAQAPYQAQVQQYQGQQNRGWFTAQDRGPESENVLIILDASESMTLNVDGGRESRMEAARRVIVNTLGKIPPNVNVGLRVYGDINPNSPSACNATRTLVPMGPNNRMQIASRIVGIKPTGMTPISYALERAIIEDFAPLSGKKSIILVSDGAETCAKDPCDVVVQMVKHNVDVKINVVGYGLQDLDSQKQLKCVALATKGKFYNADTSAALGTALGELFQVKKEVKAQILTPTVPKVTAPAVKPAAKKPAPKIQELKAY